MSVSLLDLDAHSAAQAEFHYESRAGRVVCANDGRSRARIREKGRDPAVTRQANSLGRGRHVPLTLSGTAGWMLSGTSGGGGLDQLPPLRHPRHKHKARRKDGQKWLRMIRQFIHAIKKERSRKDSKPNEASQPDVVYAVHLSNNHYVSKDPSPTVQTSKKAGTHKAARSE